MRARRCEFRLRPDAIQMIHRQTARKRFTTALAFAQDTSASACIPALISCVWLSASSRWPEHALRRRLSHNSNATPTDISSSLPAAFRRGPNAKFSKSLAASCCGSRFDISSNALIPDGTSWHEYDLALPPVRIRLLASSGTTSATVPNAN